jgi:hypothetical protein
MTSKRHLHRRSLPPAKLDEMIEEATVLDLPLPTPPPEGWEWIEAFRHWAGGR